MFLKKRVMNSNPNEINPRRDQTGMGSPSIGGRIALQRPSALKKKGSCWTIWN
jgi:hypothetical protein